jgi:hypothetical protein
MDLALSICLGVGLAVACGFRVFVPLLGLSAAALAGHVQLAEEMAWLGTWPALLCFLTAALVEIAAYYVPWIDNALDSVATPTAVVAGTLVTASVVTDMSPLMTWTLALIAGGGTAGLIQSTTVALRGASSLTTGGLANWLVASGEMAASLLTTVLALVWPLVGLALALFLALVLLRLYLRAPRRPGPAAGGTP